LTGGYFFLFYTFVKNITDTRFTPDNQDSFFNKNNGDIND